MHDNDYATIYYAHDDADTAAAGRVPDLGRSPY